MDQEEKGVYDRVLQRWETFNDGAELWNVVGGGVRCKRIKDRVPQEGRSSRLAQRYGTGRMGVQGG